MNIKLIKNNIPHFGKSEKGLMTFKELERLINLRPFCSPHRFGACVNKKYWIDRYDWITDDSNTWPASLIKEILEFSSCYFTDCTKVNEKINSYAEKLEKLFNRPVDCHIYFSLNKGAEGFGKHKDVSKNVIVVCEGKLNFKIYYNDKILEKNLSKGDYAFIPDQIYHTVTPLTDKRLSCSFPVSHINENYLFDNREWFKIKDDK